MIENLGGVTSEVAWLALDALSLRHQVISHNIANAETPGFVPKRLEFSEHLLRISLQTSKLVAKLAGNPLLCRGHGAVILGNCCLPQGYSVWVVLQRVQAGEWRESLIDA